jgi:hypothetical protein
MAKCERIIIESEERDKERRKTLLQMKDPDQKSNPEGANEDSSPTVNGSMVDLIENFDDVRAQITPNEKHSKPEDQLIFDFNS